MLKTRITDALSSLSLAEVCRAIDQFPKRLVLLKSVNGEYFEHLL